MSIRIVCCALCVLLYASTVNGQCYVIRSADCIEFESLFGVQEVECKSEPCGATMDGFECEDIEAENDYFDNELDYAEDPPLPSEAGTTSYNSTQGDPCIRTRACDDCKGVFPNVPDCNSLQNWTTSLWGSDLTPAGAPCVG